MINATTCGRTRAARSRQRGRNQIEAPSETSLGERVDRREIVVRREEFWAQALDALAVDSSWAERFSGLDACLARFDGGSELLPIDLSCSDEAVGGPGPETPLGYRAFLLRWKAGVCSDLHGHPNVAYLSVISGRFRITHYAQSDDGEPQQVGAIALAPGDSDGRGCSEPGWSHHLHRVECQESGWCFHLYSGDPRLGSRFPEPD